MPVLIPSALNDAWKKHYSQLWRRGQREQPCLAAKMFSGNAVWRRSGAEWRVKEASSSRVSEMNFSASCCLLCPLHTPPDSTHLSRHAALPAPALASLRSLFSPRLFIYLFTWSLPQLSWLSSHL